MMFGRAGEEAAYLRRHGIEVTIVPGVTAALGCAASSQIPLTLRGVSRSIQFVTAHCMDDDATNAMDWSKLANPDGTLAIYMGRSQLPHFSAKLIEAGLSPDTPAAAIENGTLPTERRCFATLSTLAARAVSRTRRRPHAGHHRPRDRPPPAGDLQPRGTAARTARLNWPALRENPVQRRRIKNLLAHSFNIPAVRWRIDWKWHRTGKLEMHVSPSIPRPALRETPTAPPAATASDTGPPRDPP